MEEVKVMNNIWDQECKFRGVDRVNLKNVIVTEKIVGEGTEKSPIRYLTQIWDTDGTLLASSEPLNERHAVLPAFRDRFQ